MKLFLQVLFLVALLPACQLDEQGIIYNVDFKKTSSFDRIQLDELDNYQAFCQKMEEIICQDGHPLIGFQDGTISKALNPVNTCEILKWDPHPRDIITITEKGDILKSGKRYPLTEMKMILKKDYYNEAQEEDFSVQPARLVIIIKQEDKAPLGHLVKILQEITRAYDALRAGVRLKILFNLNKKVAPSKAS